jgi:hypothetical protein
MSSIMIFAVLVACAISIAIWQMMTRAAAAAQATQANDVNETVLLVGTAEHPVDVDNTPTSRMMERARQQAQTASENAQASPDAVASPTTSPPRDYAGLPKVTGSSWVWDHPFVRAAPKQIVCRYVVETTVREDGVVVNNYCNQELFDSAKTAGDHLQLKHKVVKHEKGKSTPTTASTQRQLFIASWWSNFVDRTCEPKPAKPTVIDPTEYHRPPISDKISNETLEWVFRLSTAMLQREERTEERAQRKNNAVCQKCKKKYLDHNDPDNKDQFLQCCKCAKWQSLLCYNVPNPKQLLADGKLNVGTYVCPNCMTKRPRVEV